MFETVVVLGSAGFLGRHLVAEFEGAGSAVIGVDRRSFSSDDECNAELAATIAGPRAPALLIHAAGLVGVHDEAALRSAHLDSTLALLKSVTRWTPRARVVVIGSAAELGLDRAEAAVVGERESGMPSMPYGVSKLAQSAAARRIALAEDLDLVRVRLFNTLGPGQSTALVGGAMVDRLHRAWRAGESKMVVRDPRAVRDFMDVRDVARAIRTVAERLPRDPGRVPVNVCTGLGTTVAALAGELVAVSGTGLALEFEPSSGGGSRVVGDNSTLRELAGTASVSNLETSVSLADMWNARRSEAARSDRNQ